ncbi:phage tail tape measure protein [Fontivita pretiosa]|uniref:phage tail tape measure protein n=1 Tax=Fontivita pretiosa TaxID=2989684 RepID=UPI003D16F8A4
MAFASGIRAGSAYVELLVKDSSFVKGLQKASKRLRAFGEGITSIGKKLTAVGAAIVAPLAAMGKHFASSEAQLLDLSERTGLSTEALSELGYAAGQTGADLGALEAGVRKMQRSVFAAASGSKAAAEAFAALGVDLGGLATMNPEQQFTAIADALWRVQDPTARAALAMQIFGRAGTALLPMMQRGEAGLNKYRKRARELGLTVSSESAAAADELDDALADLGSVVKRTSAAIGSALAGTLREAAVRMTELAVKVNAFIKEHRQLVVTVFKVAAAVVVAGTGIVVFGAVLAKVGAALGLLAMSTTKAAAVLRFVGSIFAWLVSPIGLTIAAVAALGAYLIYVSGAGAKALAWLAQRFNELRAEAVAAFGGISDALAAGDIGLAARILWLTLKLEWDKGIAAIQPVWLQFKLWFLKIAYGAFYGALAAWEIVQHALSVAWIETTAFLSKTWTNFTSFVQSAWEGVQNWLENRWHDLFTLFDDTYDAAAAKDLANRLSQQTQNEIERQRQNALAQTELERVARRQLESQQSESELARIGGEYNAMIADVTAANAAKIKAAQDAIDAARDEWIKAINEARSKRTARETESGGPGKPKGPPDIAARFAGLSDLLAQAQNRTIGVAGTFNAAEARGLGAGGVADRIAKASEQTAANTRKLLEEIRDLEPGEFE